MEKPIFYEAETENARFIAEMLHENRVNPKIVLTPVGGYPWPVFFAEEFPKAAVFSFDNNKRQIQEYTSQIRQMTGHKPKFLDVRNSERFANIFNSHEIELVFMSNIPDYMRPEVAEEVATMLAEYEVKWIAFSHMSYGSNAKGYHAEGCESVIKTLKDEGYTIKHSTDTSGSYDVSELYLAIKE